jgi:hypothetical protein
MFNIKPINDGKNFHHLSVKDLIEARDLFHIHLMNKKNVIATAIGRYRVRSSDIDIKTGNYIPSKKYPKPKRTLEDSVVPDFAWPCVLVFVRQWADEQTLINDGEDNIIPKSIYMPDGRVIPICVVEASKSITTDVRIDEQALLFPKNLISGGFPLIVYSQGEKRIASVGCLVSDGNKIYALTNKHVVGKEGTEIFSRLNGREVRIGTSCLKQYGKGKFVDLYPGWHGTNLIVNNDVGLIEIDDLSVWKTEVFGIGQINELKDLNTSNISLNLIPKKVSAFGAVSKEMKGEIIALFYRYKSVGGVEYVSDYLIGGRDGQALNIHHGDSGTLWLIEDEEKVNGQKETILRPFALQWGQHEFIDGSLKQARPYAMATSLSNILRELDVDLVRGWNLDQDYSWGKTGHFKIGARACDLVTDKKLLKLLQANKFNIGYSDEDLNFPSRLVKMGSGKFVPLADVADLVWRGSALTVGVSRSNDEQNHFADMDEKHPDVFDNQSLLDLCFTDNGKLVSGWIDKNKWLDFYRQLDQAKPQPRGKKRLGGLPFRVWQMYDLMVEALKLGKVDEFICAGGCMSHYVGDACQPLHGSHKYDGIEDEDKGVHGKYEDEMLTNKNNRIALFKGINSFNTKVKSTHLFTGGQGAAESLVRLMKRTFDRLSPDVIIKASRKSENVEQLWEKVGAKTIDNINDGSLVMAAIWQSGWKEGSGNNISTNKLVEISKDQLMDLYYDLDFVPSFKLSDLELKEEVVSR